MTEQSTNKYGVPYHLYCIIHKSGVSRIVNVGDEDDWGNIQECVPGDCEDWEEAIGYGNDDEGHKQILTVIDCEDGSVWTGKNAVMTWYNSCVSIYVDNYSA